jgi:glucose/arabinose dehydrogenase
MADCSLRGLLPLAVALALLLLPTPLVAQDRWVRRVADGFERPVFLTQAPGEDDRVFVAEQHTGRIRILNLADGSIEPEPFLDLEGISTGNEQGLLGVAFHPDYATNGFVYVYVTDPDSRLLRFTALEANRLEPSSQLQILSFTQPQANHNAGWIGFGPDGYLYVASGDGGSGNDDGAGHTPEIGNAQDVTDNLLGKILRIDPDLDDFPSDPDRHYAIPPDNPFVGVTGDDEIWAYGLRNPWRPSFDRATGDLYVADVGQAACEEIDVLVGGGLGGENFGWRLREGVIATPAAGIGGDRPAGALDPIMDYPHPGAICSGPPAEFVGRSITGGYVYRGPVTELAGRYFFADFVTGQLWSLRFDGSDPALFDGTNYTDLTNHAFDPRFTPDVGAIGRVSSFGEDREGALYVLDLSDGEVFVVPEASTLGQALVALATVGGVIRLRSGRPASRARGSASPRANGAPRRRPASAVAGRGSPAPPGSRSAPARRRGNNAPPRRR